MSSVIENLKLGKLSSHRYVNNVETNSDNINQVDVSDNKDSAERNETSKNHEETLNDFDGEYDEIY